MAHRILTIDDSLTIRQFIQKSLPLGDGFEVSLARDGTEGVALAQSQKPDLILLDFILPDMKGDEVCRLLGESPETARLPIVLMSSSAGDMKRTEASFSSVVRSIAKPFTPELLTATVRYVLREVSNRAATPASAIVSAPPAKKAAPSSGGLTMLGDTSKFPLLRVLQAIGHEHLTGVLRLFIEERPLKIWFERGNPRAVSHQDASLYLRGNLERFTAEQTSAIEISMKGQSDCGCPVFLGLAQRGLMPLAQAQAACHRQGLHCLAPQWTALKLRFEFESQSALPDFCSQLNPFPGDIDEWAMESLRMVGDEALTAIAWDDLTGIPAYTRSGYERIQQLPLFDEELRFVRAVNGSDSLLTIAGSLGLSGEAAQMILYRFLALEIFDYWPESLMSPAPETSAS